MTGTIAAKIDWTRRHMPVLAATAKDVDKPFAGLAIGLRIHLEPKTAVLVEALQGAGATVIGMGNEGTTQFDTVDYLNSIGATILDDPADGSAEFEGHMRTIAAARPDLLLDNGAELIVTCLDTGHDLRGATEETTSGAFVLREQFAGRVDIPVIVINDSPLKSIVENKHGVGESVVDTIVRTTNVTFHKKHVVVFGYGWCGRGIALYARHRGADVTVVELDPVKALEAAMDGFDTDTAERACLSGNVFITATGRDDVISHSLIETMPDGAVLANAGHVSTEIDVAGLALHAVAEDVSPSIRRYQVRGDTSVFVLADGQIVNLAAEGGKGNPIEAMDVGLTLQFLSLLQIAAGSGDLPLGPQPVPHAIDRTVAEATLRSMGGRIGSSG